MKMVDVCRYIEEHCERPSQAKFASDVRRQIEFDDLLYPTTSQRVILMRIFKHLEGINRSQVEREAREFLGLK